MHENHLSAGEKTKARDILAAIRTLHTVEREQRPASDDELQVLRKFGGFGAVALSIFPDPQTGRFKDGWEDVGRELQSLLTPAEYDSAKRTTFSQFFTSPVVMGAMHQALSCLGVPATATVLEPGCGSGAFMTGPHHYIGVEQDSLSGRIARVLHPQADIRIENFRDTKLPLLDAVIGNVPFADVKLDFKGQKLALHDFFIAKSLDALKPGGVLAVVTSHFTLDKQNAATREQLAAQADFLGAIRLPSDAFKREGTAVVTDILFLRKRAPGQEPKHADPAWLETGPLNVEDATVAVNRYFLNHPEAVLGQWSRKDTLYGGEGFSVTSHGDLATQLRIAVSKLPRFEPTRVEAQRANPPPETNEKHQVNGVTHQVKASGHQVAPAFIPPPPLKHISEGSFFVHDGRIHQMEGGQSVPVVYGGGELWSNGALVGRRMGALIELRDLSRRVLQSQNEGWPETAREEARRNLNQAYDRFHSAYGPINKTTFSPGKDDGQIRRMPNLVKFREDPDAMLVMSLEEYDEATGKAEKAAIMRQDVVGPKPPVTRVTCAEDGLLVSLDHKGGIDLPYISTLYGKPEQAVVAELGDLIYRDPESKRWETADAYLSGNVRAKLVTAEKAGPEYTRNVTALRQVQPEDVLPGDIDANLGAPWIPASDIQAFAGELFGVPAESIKIGHLKKDALWSVEPDYLASNSVAATADFGTSRINGTALLEQTMNLKSPVIYDTVYHDGKEQRIVNTTETLAAKEKQRQIKDRFKAWIFADPDRTERLVRDYNDAFNNLRPRLFDGSHLEFPGISKAVTLRQHQVDGVWRCMTGGNTLLAHTVGAGKTMCMVASAMKMKQTGLVKKPLCVVPNHMLEQFTREWLQLYPNARILTATKEDFTKDRRKFLTAKIATGDWDGIIVTHSGFEHMGMSAEFQADFLRGQIAEYESMLIDKASKGRNIIKTLEKQKANREEKLKSLLAEKKKDDGLVFDELGVDQIFYDECQAVKNAEVPTKMERVAGIPGGGSQRAFDFAMKAAYLDQRHPGHGLVGASGTPISNSMAEMYIMQRYFDPAGLRSRGIEHFDGWAATFGEVVEAMEISPDGATLKPRSRFAKFVNLPELVQMFRSFADVQTAEMLDLPRPKLEGGKPQTVACPMSDEQHAMQAKLVERYEKIRNERVDPRIDNALAITTDGRKLALDGRMLGAGGDFAESKVNALVGNVVRIWNKTEAARGTQMIFCDMGVHPNPFSVYDEIASKLADQGIPASQIAIMGDADTDAKKNALFEKVRQGTVRVLIGSTAKMGTGTNVQKRLVALHHLDAPWKPAEVEQREGRILRQGNTNEEVAIYRYVTEASFDAYMWQALETKARFIAQIMTGDCAVRKAEDVGGQELSYAEVKAIASGNPAVLTLAETDAELQRLAILRKNHHDEQYLARRNLKELPERIRSFTRRIESLTADIATLTAHEQDRVTVGNRTLSNADAVEALTARLERLPETVSETRTMPMGMYHGLAFGVILHHLGGMEAYLDGQVIRRTDLRGGGRALLNALDRLADGYALDRERCQQDKAVAEGQLWDYESRLGAVFRHGDYERQLMGLRDKLKAGLSEKAAESKEGEPTVIELDAQIKALRASNAVEAVARIGTKPPARAERPVTARIVRTKAEVHEPEAPVTPDAPQELAKPVDEDESDDAPGGNVIALPEPKPTAIQPPRHTQRITQRRRVSGNDQPSLFD
ncbi:DEAD/DEAH box helicase family protein [Limnoglobus roseus]|uniref:Helicase n=1 Tax=Limnoglobus roseus TaxID=2598579 RepID=A0A5C1AAG1_9BACT|nr:DEAD/DEAH box helicase family protein [Limnoglobus roseus]QEL14812.1 helicase [Limnoglobus roseus]